MMPKVMAAKSNSTTNINKNFLIFSYVSTCWSFCVKLSSLSLSLSREYLQIRKIITVQLTTCFICFDSAALFNSQQQQIYLFGQSQTSQKQGVRCTWIFPHKLVFSGLSFTNPRYRSPTFRVNNVIIGQWLWLSWYNTRDVVIGAVVVAQLV